MGFMHWVGVSAIEEIHAGLEGGSPNIMKASSTFELCRSSLHLKYKAHPED